MAEKLDDKKKIKQEEGRSLFSGKKPLNQELIVISFLDYYDPIAFKRKKEEGQNLK